MSPSSWSLAQWLMAAGILLLVSGVLLWLLQKLGIPLGHIPGDIHIEGKRGSFRFPLVTCLLISVIATLLLNFWGRG